MTRLPRSNLVSCDAVPASDEQGATHLVGALSAASETGVRSLHRTEINHTVSVAYSNHVRLKRNSDC